MDDEKTNPTAQETKPQEFYEYDNNVSKKGYNEASPILTNMPNKLEIPEVKIVRPVINMGGGNNQTVDLSKQQITNHELQTTDNKQQTRNPENSSDINEKFKQPVDLDDKNKRKNAKRLALMVINAYEQLHTFLYMGMSLDNEKLKRRAMRGKFDMDALKIKIQIGNEQMTVLSYLKDYDRSLRRVLEVEDDDRCHLDEDFVDAVLPGLIEIFYDNSLGANNVVNTGYYFLMDVIAKGTQLIGIKIGINTLLKEVSNMMLQANQLTDENLINHEQQTTNHEQQTIITANTLRENTIAQVYGTQTNPIDNINVKPPDHSIQHQATLTTLPKKGGGRKVGSKDSKPRSNKNYLISNKRQNKNKSENNESSEELLEFIPENNKTQKPIELLKEA